MWAFRVSGDTRYAPRLVSSTEQHCRCPNGTIPWGNPGRMNGGLGTNSGQLLLSLTRQEFLVVPTKVEQRAIRAHFDDPVRQPAHELAVVRHEDQRAFELLERDLQRLDRL